VVDISVGTVLRISTEEVVLEGKCSPLRSHVTQLTYLIKQSTADIHYCAVK
jgi:hypothetical protein